MVEDALQSFYHNAWRSDCIIKQLRLSQPSSLLSPHVRDLVEIAKGSEKNGREMYSKRFQLYLE